MKIPRTMNQQYAIIRAVDEEQRRRKTCVKRETVTPSVCRSITLTPDVVITIPNTPSTENTSQTSSVTTPHAHPIELPPSNTFSW